MKKIIILLILVLSINIFAVDIEAYNKAIKYADINFDMEAYEMAQNYYEKAIAAKPNDEHATKRLQFIKSKVKTKEKKENSIPTDAFSKFSEKFNTTTNSKFFNESNENDFKILISQAEEKAQNWNYSDAKQDLKEASFLVQDFNQQDVVDGTEKYIENQRKIETSLTNAKSKADSLEFDEAYSSLKQTNYITTGQIGKSKINEIKSYVDNKKAVEDARLAKLEAERLEKERLAKLETERLEKERLQRGKLEEERIAQLEDEAFM